MIIGCFRKENKSKKVFLNYLSHLKIKRKVIRFIKHLLKGEDFLQAIFFNIYGPEDHYRIIDGKNKLHELLEDKKFKKIEKTFIRFDEISGIQFKKDIRIDIYIPGFNNLGPAVRDWWEFINNKKIKK